jgi:hypothetical protein
MTNVQCSSTSNGAPVFGFTDPMAASHRIGLQDDLSDFTDGVRSNKLIPPDCAW